LEDILTAHRHQEDLKHLQQLQQYYLLLNQHQPAPFASANPAAAQHASQHLMSSNQYTNAGTVPAAFSNHQHQPNNHGASAWGLQNMQAALAGGASGQPPTQGHQQVIGQMSPGPVQQVMFGQQGQGNLQQQLGPGAHHALLTAGE
jgi:hypothetical protein